MQKKRSIPLLVLIGVLVAALGVGNMFAFKYAPINQHLSGPQEL